MKSRFVCACVVLGGLLALASPGFAESAGFRAPFAFEAGGKVLPAGGYTVETTGNLLIMRGSAPGAAAMLLAEIVDTGVTGESPKISFMPDGAMRVLSSVTFASGATYVPLPAKHALAAQRPASNDVLLSRH